MINLNNYEEWFVLYMDEELTADQKAAVEAFVLQHPHLQQELDLLLGTKLPTEPVTFTAKEALLSGAMKLNTVDEALLLYIDNELPAAEKKVMEDKITSDATYRLQHDLLQQTKLSSADVVLYPNKEELYHSAGKVAFFPVWMRIAVAVVLILFTSLFFLLNNKQQAVDAGYAVTEQPATRNETPTPVTSAPETILPKDQTAALETKPATNTRKNTGSQTPVVLPQKENTSNEAILTQEPVQTASVKKIEPVQLTITKLTQEPAVGVNNLVANSSVTSAAPVAYNTIETPDEAAGSDGDYKGAKRTSAKGFLRKVSRFIEKRTGIGTVNADNELLVGAVALKLN